MGHSRHHLQRGWLSLAFRFARSPVGQWRTRRRLRREIRRCLNERAPGLAEDGLLITTFFNRNIPMEIPDHQQQVMASLLRGTKNKHWVPFTTDLAVRHDQFIDAVLKEAFRRVAWVMILDVDAIPLNKHAIDLLWNQAREGALAGVEQSAFHLGSRHDYIAPAAVCVSREVFALLGAPSAVADAEGDVLERFTRAAEEHGVRLWPLRVSRYMAEPSWPLADGRRFGIGTYYGSEGEELFFHNFCSRRSQRDALVHFHHACEHVLAAAGEDPTASKAPIS